MAKGPFWRADACSLEPMTICRVFLVQNACLGSLSALLGVIVPGQSRKVETVFVVSDLVAVGISSVRTETDEWLLNLCVRCKRAAPCQKHPGEAEEKRLRLAADMPVQLPDPLADTKELRSRLRDMFRWAQWLCRFTFRENDCQ